MRLVLAALLLSSTAAADSSEFDASLGIGVARGERNDIHSSLTPGPTFGFAAGIWHGPVAFALRVVSFTGIGTNKTPTESDISTNALIIAANVQYAPTRRLWITAGPGLDFATGAALAEDLRLGVVFYDTGPDQLNLSLELLHASRPYTEAEDAHAIWTLGLLVGFQERPGHRNR